MAPDDIVDVFVRERLSDKGGRNFTRLSAADVRTLFELYDNTIFEGGISAKLAENSVVLAFKVDNRLEGTVGELEIEENKYTVSISPRFLLNTPSTRVALLAETVQHQVVHMAMILWGYYGREPSTIFGGYGTLFTCMMHTYFPTTTTTDILDIVILLTDYLPITQPLGGFENWQNSCYLDSVLMVLFESSSEWWRREMLERIPLPSDPSDLGCDVFGGSEVETPEELFNFRLKVRDTLRDDYERINTGGEVIKCIRLRQLLQTCLPELREEEVELSSAEEQEESEQTRIEGAEESTPRGTWTLFNAGAIYDLLATLFPTAKMTVPVQIVHWDDTVKQHIPQPAVIRRFSTVPMWDFMDPHTDVENSGYERILWEDASLTSEVLVFINGGTPRVKNFNKAGRETGYFYINKVKTTYDVTKARAFGPMILNNRYRLIGVVTLLGVSPTQEGGSHYISYFLSTSGEWYRYNDLSGRAVAISKLPVEGVWEEKGGQMPAMYFYEKAGL